MIDHIEQSASDLGSIEHLENNKHFQGFYMRRLNERAAKLRETILHDSTVKGDDLQGLRHELWSLEGAIDLLKTDRVLCEEDSARAMQEFED